MFHVNEKYRIRTGLLASDASYGNEGAFEIPISGRTSLFVIAACGENWEHCSVHAVSDGKQRTPTWAEMCKVKDIFWDAEDCVVQFHPPKSEYVNVHEHVLHLWKPICYDIKTPPQILV